MTQLYYQSPSLPPSHNCFPSLFLSQFKQLDVEDPRRSPFMNKKMVTEIYQNAVNKGTLHTSTPTPLTTHLLIFISTSLPTHTPHTPHRASSRSLLMTSSAVCSTSHTLPPPPPLSIQLLLSPLPRCPGPYGLCPMSRRSPNGHQIPL